MATGNTNRKGNHTTSSLQISNNTSEEGVVDIRIDGEIGYRSYWWEDDDENRVLTSKELRAELNRISEIQATRIRVYINSLGGLVNHALNMYDALAAHSAHITTIIEGGYSASAATIIFMAGDKRKISENALFLIHKSLISPWDWSFNENALKDLLEDVRATDKRLRAIYEKAGVSTTDVEELMNAQYGNGKWIDAQEAGPAPDGYGFATEIVEARGLMTASATSKSRHLRLNKQGLPPLPPTPVVKHSNKHKKSKRMSKNKSLFDQVKDYFSNNQVEKTEEEIEQGLGNMSARIEELEASEKKLQNENTDLQSQIDNLKQEKSALEADLEAQSKALTAAKEDLQKEVETAKTTHEETIKAKDKEIQNLTKERDDLNAKFEKQKGGKTVVDGGSDPSLVNTPKSDNEAAYEDNVAYFEKMTGSK